MTVVGLHPEELFDKLVDGSLSGAEAERLRAHLADCSVCRFELAVRGDFEADRHKPPAPLPAPTPAPAPGPVPFAAERRRIGSRRRPAWVWGIAAAALFMATGALASVYTGVAPWKLFDAPAAAPAANGPSAGEARRTKKARPARRDIEAALPAEAAAPSAISLVDTAPVKTVRDRAAAPIAARAVEPRTAEPPVEANAATLFADANRARASGDSAGAIRLYRQLQQRFPRSSEAALSELTLATLLLHTGDPRSALTSFDKYLGRGSRPLDAEALVGRALSLRALGLREQETSAWRSVIDRYPESSYARRAAERLAALRKP